MFLKELLDIVTLTKIDSTYGSIASDCYTEVIVTRAKVTYLELVTKVVLYAVNLRDI